MRSLGAHDARGQGRGSAGVAKATRSALRRLERACSACALCSMHHRLVVHLVWTTRDRLPSINRVRAQYLWEHLPIIVRQERGRLLELGIVTTHLHMLVRLHPTTQLPRLLQRMKGGSAYGINGAAAIGQTHLRWAKGYSVTSVSPRAMPSVSTYVHHQHLRHPEEAIAGWSNDPVASATPAASSATGSITLSVPSRSPPRCRSGSHSG